MSNDRFYVPDIDADMYNVPKGGWYIFDDNHRAVDGPFGPRKKLSSRNKPARKARRGKKVGAPSTSRTKSKRTAKRRRG